MAYNSRGDVIQTDGCVAEIFSICYSHSNIVVPDMTKSSHHLLELPGIHPHNHEHIHILITSKQECSKNVCHLQSEKDTDAEPKVFYSPSFTTAGKFTKKKYIPMLLFKTLRNIYPELTAMTKVIIAARRLCHFNGIM